MTRNDAARSGALVVDRPERGTLVVIGDDRVSWLQGVLTCDVADLAPGEGRWGLALTKQGKIISDVDVVAGTDRVFLGCSGTVAASLLDWLDGFLIMEDAEIEDESATLRWISLHGPASAGARERVGSGCVASGSIDWTGLGGAALVVESNRTDEVLGKLTAHGATIASSEDWERLRIERRIPELGIDMDGTLNPHEASLDRRAISWDKGCYLGQEAVCMQDMRGKVKRRIALVRVVSGDPPEAAAPVLGGSDGEVGRVTSSARSLHAGAPVALVLVKAAVAQPGQRLRVGDSEVVVEDPL